MEWRTFSTHMAEIIAADLIIAGVPGLWIYFRKRQLFQQQMQLFRQFWMVSLTTTFVITAVTTSLTWLAVGMSPFRPQAYHKLEVWTPTPKTKDAPGVKGHDNYKWMVIDDKKLTEFAQELSHNRKEIPGFRWSEVEGSGEGPLEAGAWWVVTLGEGYTCTEFFRQHYGPIWNPGKDGVYYEVNGMGDHWYQKQKCRGDS